MSGQMPISPTSALRSSGLVSLIAVLVLPAAALLVPAKIYFVPIALALFVGALAIVHRCAPQQARSFALVYFGGAIGCSAAYGYLALTNSGVTLADEVSGWGLLDKRPVVFAYVLIGAFLAHHWLVVAVFSGSTAASKPARDKGSKIAKVAGAVVAALLAYCWIGLPALLSVDPGAGPTLAKFYEFHNHAQLGTMEQIRLGAVPYLEAQTQYGVGNLELLYGIIRQISFSSHGAFASCVLLDAVCIVFFFIVLQQAVGLGWAVAGMLGWVLWPSPINVISVMPAWAVLTRWLAVPLLSLLLAHLLLKGDPNRRPWLGAMLSGAIWGVSAFLSQESLGGGVLVLVLSLALYAPAAGMTLRSAAIFVATFVASGATLFIGSLSVVVGFAHWFDAYQLAAKKANLVTAGITNSWWSDALNSYAQWRALVQTYAFAIVQIVVIGLLGHFLVRRWQSADDETRTLVRRFAGVSVGAFALHVFSLLRSDATHLSGPSFLLPLMLLMLPVFAWRCLPSSRLRAAMLVVGVLIVAEGMVSGAPALYGQLKETVTARGDSAAVFEFYREMRSQRAETPDVAGRYSPLPRYQVAIRNHPDFAEVEEVFGLLRQHLRGRRLELGFYRIDDVVAYPELFYFLGGFRSVSGITSPLTSIWLRPEFEAWIDKVVSAKSACVFFEPDPDVESNPRRALYQAWARSTKGLEGVTAEPIRGRRLYGVLTCKP